MNNSLNGFQSITPIIRLIPNQALLDNKLHESILSIIRCGAFFTSPFFYSSDQEILIISY